MSLYLEWVYCETLRRDTEPAIQTRSEALRALVTLALSCVTILFENQLHLLSVIQAEFWNQHAVLLELASAEHRLGTTLGVAFLCFHQHSLLFGQQGFADLQDKVVVPMKDVASQTLESQEPCN